MTDAVKTTELPSSNAIIRTDKVLGLKDGANTVSYTITTLVKAYLVGLPVYPNEANAVAGGLSTGEGYLTDTGTFKVVMANSAFVGP